MSRLPRLVSTAAMLALPLVACGHGLFHRHVQPTAAYYVAPVMPPACMPMPMAAEPPVALTAPAGSVAPRLSPVTPAPPSSTSTPPSSIGGPPKVSETRSYYAGSSLAPSKSVGFWNLSDCDVSLRIENGRYWLPRGANLRFQLASQFEWQVDARSPEQEIVPATTPGVDIVIWR